MTKNKTHTHIVRKMDTKHKYKKKKKTSEKEGKKEGKERENKRNRGKKRTQLENREPKQNTKENMSKRKARRVRSERNADNHTLHCIEKDVKIKRRKECKKTKRPQNIFKIISEKKD